MPDDHNRDSDSTRNPECRDAWLEADLLRLVLDALPDPVFIKNSDFVYTLANRRMAEFLGRTPEDFLGRRDAEVFKDNPDFLAIQRCDQQVLATRTDAHCELALTGIDGSKRLFDVTKKPFLNLDRQVDGIISIYRDITDLRRQERETAASAAELAQIFETTGSNMWIIGTDFVVRRVNQTMARLIGKDVRDMVGRKCHDVFGGRDCGTPSCRLRRIMSGEERIEEEVEKAAGNGTIVPCLLTATPLRDSQGKLTGMVESFMDISARKRHEALREDVDRIMRHDLRTPLGGIVQIAAMLRDEPGLTGDSLEALAMIEETGRRMLDMINVSLDLHKIEMGTYALEAAPVDILPMLRRILAETREKTRARNLQVAILLDGAAPGLEDQALALGHGLLLYTMLANIFVNAVEASPNTSQVTARLERSGPALTLRVHNQGSVPLDMRGRFFEKYATSGKKRGTGLGTYSAKIIAEAHHGRIGFETSEQDGTTVWVELPAPARD